VSVTDAVIVEAPPADDSVAGLALTNTAPTAAEPTAIFTAFVPLADTPPEIAVIVAVPDPPLATYVTTTRPVRSVSASDGSSRPRFVVKVILVPLWGGVPAASITCAMMLVVPLIGSAVDKAVRLMVDPVGARSGTFSQATVRRTKLVTTALRANAQRKRDIMKAITIIVPMKLAGQASRSPRSQQGYAMAALLVAMSIMALMMTVVMPVWKHATQREKEEELVFRGLQYVHAIAMFQRKFANAYPPNVDVLVEQRFLRKKFKDPITNDDFVLLPAGAGMPGVGLGTAGQRGTGSATPGATPGATAGRGTASTTAPQPSQAAAGRSGGLAPIAPLAPIGTQNPTGGTVGGIGGVTSKSKDQSIRLYNGRGHYNEWAFVYIPQIQAPGQGGAPGTAQPGQRGQPGQPSDPFGAGGIGGRGRGGQGTQNPGRPGGPGPPGTNPGGRGFGPGTAQPIFPPTPRGRF